MAGVGTVSHGLSRLHSILTGRLINHLTVDLAEYHYFIGFPMRMQWLKAYPKAKGYGCPGIKAKLPDAGYAIELSTSNEAPSEWKGEIEHTFLGYEHNPFTGKPFFNEVCPPLPLPSPVLQSNGVIRDEWLAIMRQLIL